MPYSSIVAIAVPDSDGYRARYGMCLCFVYSGAGVLCLIKRCFPRGWELKEPWL